MRSKTCVGSDRTKKLAFARRLARAVVIAVAALVISAPVGAEQLPETAKALSDEAKVSAFYEVGLTFYRGKHYDEAFKAFSSAAELKPHYRDLDYYLYVTRENKEKLSGNSIMQQARPEGTGDMEEVGTLYKRGVSLAKEGKHREAAESFQRVLAIDPRHKGAWRGLLESSAALDKSGGQGASGRPIGMKPKRETVMESDPNELLYQECKVLMKNNRLDEAVARYEELYNAAPDYKDVRQGLYKARLDLAAKERDENGAPYTLGAGDLIELNVQNHPELSGQVSVEAGGEVILPLVREVVQVTGLTKEEAGKLISAAFAKYVKEPEVQVVITGYNSKKWYILGEVGFQGEFPMGRARLTLMEALYRAGLPREGTAAMGRVLHIKPHRSKPYQRSIDVQEILYAGNMQNNTYIEPGDIIYVPKTVMTKINYWVAQIVAPINTARGIQGNAEDYLSVSSAAASMQTKDFLHPSKTRRRTYSGNIYAEGAATGNQTF